jgi:hypothetical protein
MQQFFEDSRIIEPLHQGPLTEHFGSYTLLLNNRAIQDHQHKLRFC